METCASNSQCMSNSGQEKLDYKKIKTFLSIYPTARVNMYGSCLGLPLQCKNMQIPRGRFCWRQAYLPSKASWCLLLTLEPQWLVGPLMQNCCKSFTTNLCPFFLNSFFWYCYLNIFWINVPSQMTPFFLRCFLLHWTSFQCTYFHRRFWRRPVSQPLQVAFYSARC